MGMLISDDVTWPRDHCCHIVATKRFNRLWVRSVSFATVGSLTTIWILRPCDVSLKGCLLLALVGEPLAVGNPLAGLLRREKISPLGNLYRYC